MPRTKDPNKPKGRSSAYAYFVAEKRQEKKERNEAIDFVKFSQDCSALWKDLKDKSKYNALAEQDKQRYTREMAAYVPPPDKGGKKRKSKKDKDPNKPKRGKSAFFVYSGERRPLIKKKNPDASLGEIAKQLGEEWRALSVKDKGPYEAEAKKDRKRYEREMEEYRRKQSSAADDDDEEEEEEEDEDDESDD